MDVIADIGPLRPRHRLGLIQSPTGADWHVTHCQNPFPHRLRSGLQRIHFAGRDTRNRSRGGWADVDVVDRGVRVERVAERPSLELGELGAFDDSGAMPSSILEETGCLRLYYTGWTLGGTVPFQFEIGCAVSTDEGETFEKISRAPILGRNKFDPLLLGAPWVLRQGSDYRMWYVSGTGWVPASSEGSPPTHYYTIKHAWSRDGIVWETDDRICIPYRPEEYAIARPVVRPAPGGYQMWYSSRRLGETYRVYKAVSKDGLVWEREGVPFIDVGSASWESDMVCYAAPLIEEKSSLMIYNGNAYGRAGFGAVTLEPTVPN